MPAPPMGYNTGMKLPRYSLFALLCIATGLAGGMAFGRVIAHHESVAVVICAVALSASVLFILTANMVYLIRRALRRD